MSWDFLISGYGWPGHGFEILKLFSQIVMANAVPDEVTVIPVVEACNQISVLLLASLFRDGICSCGNE